MGAPENVERATRAALAPWHIEIVTAPADPALVSESSFERARTLARTHDADAVVWLTVSETGHALRLFDARQEHLLTRPLASGPPFSEPAAASLALSIKTLLRHSRIGPHLDEHELGIFRKPRAQLGVESSSMARIGQERGPEPRFELGLLWSLPVSGRHAYTLATTLNVGLGISIDRNDFVGDFTDIALGVELRRSLVSSSRFEILALAGAALHRTHISGLIDRATRQVDVTRNNPSMDAGFVLRTRIISRLHGHLCMTGSYFPLRQTYLLYHQPVLETPRVAAEAGIGLSVPLGW